MVASSGKPGGRLPEDAVPGAVGERIAELGSYASYYVAAQLDRAKVAVRSAIVLGVLAAVGALVGASVVVTSAVLLTVGLAGGVAALCGGRPWIGDLVVATVVLGGIVVGVLVASRRLTSTSRRKLVQTYEQRASKQRDNFGADVHERARERHGS